MDEVEKLYENAGVNLGCCKHAKYGYEGEEEIWYYCTKENKECWTYPNGDADCVEKGYPPFTTEKQIELIKWLSDTDYFITEFCKLIDTKEYYIETNYKHFQSSSFEETLAGLINKLWQSLTEEEHKQIKEILE